MMDSNDAAVRWQGDVAADKSETAAPHPEEMKASFEFRIGDRVSVRAAVRTTPAGLLGVAFIAAAVFVPVLLLSKQRRSSELGG